MKKISAVVLAVVLVISALSLAGCGSKKSIVGKWETEVDIGEAVSNSLGDESEELAEAFKDVNIVAKYSFEFTDEGKFSMLLDEDALVESFKGSKDAFKKFFNEYLGAMAETMGMGIDDLLDAQGLTIDELVDEALDESVEAMKENLSDASKKGTYKIDGQKLFLAEEGEDFTDDEYVEFEFEDDNKIKFTKITAKEGEDEDEDSLELIKETLPWTLIRK
ncbi:MAG: hypothetical protein IK086_04855 [Clostridia bacterium]|nr:hypothetical protein [Clostridia bacterium]